MQSRRSILRTLSAATALVAAPQVRAGKVSGEAYAPPWWLLDPMDSGTDLGGGWSLDTVGPIVDGAAVIELSHTNKGQVRIHLCLHEGSPRGFAHTSLFDLIVIDHGRGVRPVQDDFIPVLEQLEKAIRDNELAGTSAFDQIAAMMTHKERVAAFGATQIQ